MTVTPLPWTTMNVGGNMRFWFVGAVAALLTLAGCATPESDDAGAHQSPTTVEDSPDQDDKDPTASQSFDSNPSGLRENPEIVRSLTGAIHQFLTGGSAESTDLALVYDLIDTAIVVPQMSYELNSILVLPEYDTPALVTSTGTYNDLSYSGHGSTVIHTETSGYTPHTNGFEYEVRLVDDIYWIAEPDGDSVYWLGLDVYDYVGAAGFDALRSIDGDYYIGTFLGSTASIVNRSESNAGLETWTLLVYADPLAFSLLDAFPRDLLDFMYDSDSEMLTEITVEVHPDGYVSHISGNLDEWLAYARYQIGYDDQPTDQVTLEFELSFSPEESVLEIVPPCTDPESAVQDGFDTLNC